jgi:glucokinase
MMKAISVDLGGTHATIALVEDRNILASEIIGLERVDGLAAVLPLLVEGTNRVMSRAAADRSQASAFVLCFCGLADPATGRVVSTNRKYDDATRIDLPAWCQREMGLPFVIENDARMALLGECYAGAAQGETDVVMVTLGTGIGGAVLMNGKVLRGKHILGGNLCGHIPVDFNGRRCTCGAIGCAEAEAGGWSLPLVAESWPGFAKSALSQEPAVSFRSLFEHATRGDGVALAIQERCLRIWATLTTGLIHSFDPDVVVFGGGVLASADVIVPYIQKHVIEYAWTPWGNVRIKPAELGSRAALLGAIPLLTAGPAAALSV